MYWHDPGTNYEFIGLGATAVLHGTTERRFVQIEDQIRHLLAEAYLPEPPLGPRLIGGFAFTPQYLSDRVWQAFDPACFILPHFQLERFDNRHFATINILTDRQDSPHTVKRYSEEALLSFLEEASALEAKGENCKEVEARGERIAVNEPVPRDLWTHSVEEILSLIEDGTVRKVVLAQIRELRSTNGFNHSKALRLLRKGYPECYVFLFRNGKDSAFLGASPELLCAVNGRSLTSMALAGTFPRHPDPDVDQLNKNALYESPKNRLEHRIVTEDIVSTLEQNGAKVICSEETEIRSLSNVHHLCTMLKAECNDKQSVLNWASLLHPTAALGGEPREVALALIEKLESAPRGWYGAPFGIVDSKLNGTFITAIRSGVIHGARAWIFAGAGIVEGSDPSLEWLETSWKFQPLQEALMA